MKLALGLPEEMVRGDQLRNQIDRVITKRPHLGGHLKPDPLFRAASVLETHGKAVAEHVASFEARQVDAIKDLVQHEDADCDFEETKVVDVCFYNAGRDKIKADLVRVAKAGISTAKEVEYSSGSEAERVRTRRQRNRNNLLFAHCSVFQIART